MRNWPTIAEEPSGNFCLTFEPTYCAVCGVKVGTIGVWRGDLCQPCTKAVRDASAQRAYLRGAR